MTKETKPNPVLGMLKKSAPTGGGPRTTMPVQAWLKELKKDGLIAIPTFHGLKGDNAGYRSGEIHIQLRKLMPRYFWVYRVPENSSQTHMFVTQDRGIFEQASIPDDQIAEWARR